jgi:hypothetical protein
MKDRTKTLTTKVRSDKVVGGDAITQEELTPEPITQRKRTEEGRFFLQVDRQTKSSYATYEAAERAALVIKTGYPLVHVVIHDTIERVDKVIERP